MLESRLLIIESSLGVVGADGGIKFIKFTPKLTIKVVLWGTRLIIFCSFSVFYLFGASFF
jgi:hypothetical protein